MITNWLLLSQEAKSRIDARLLQWTQCGELETNQFFAVFVWKALTVATRDTPPHWDTTQAERTSRFDTWQILWYAIVFHYPQ